MTLIINNEKKQGQGAVFHSTSPFNGEMVWSGKAASKEQVFAAVKAAKAALFNWRSRSFNERLLIIKKFAELLTTNHMALAKIISLETGKPYWEAQTEVSAMIAKVGLSEQAYLERSGEKKRSLGANYARLRHRALGVMAVFGPFNFPAHLPNGHIIPALLAGNTLVFKPSEQTPYTGEFMVSLWLEAGLPKGVINLIQGAKEVGSALLQSSEIDGYLFTGSEMTGHALHRELAGKPEKMLALEMGGNNPLVVSSSYGDLDACVYTIIQSAFLSAGQRCTCARRLFLPQNEQGDKVLARLIDVTKSIKIGAPFDEPPPFMGSLISEFAAENMMKAQAHLIQLGAKPLLVARHLGHALVTPAILEVSAVKALPDEEYFAPLLQVVRFSDFNQAIEQANATRFGLSAGLISTSESEWTHFYNHIRAGIVNRNSPLTGASGDAPFGGVGASGNLRPSAYYAADYCAYPVASIEANSPQLPSKPSPGIFFDSK